MGVLQEAATRLDDAATALGELDFSAEKADIADFLTVVSSSLTEIAQAINAAVVAAHGLGDDDPAPPPSEG